MIEKGYYRDNKCYSAYRGLTLLDFMAKKTTGQFFGAQLLQRQRCSLLIHFLSSELRNIFFPVVSSLNIYKMKVKVEMSSVTLVVRVYAYHVMSTLSCTATMIAWRKTVVRFLCIHCCNTYVYTCKDVFVVVSHFFQGYFRSSNSGLLTLFTYIAVLWYFFV